MGFSKAIIANRMKNLAHRCVSGCRVLLVTVLLVSSAGARAQVDEATAEMLMRKSGMWQQFAELSTQVRSGFRQSAERSPKPPSADEMARLDRAIDTAYAADQLRRVALQSLMRGLQPGQVDALRKWYTSPLGEKLTRLEEGAAANQSDPAALVREGSALLETLPSVRRAQYNEMLEATKAAEFTVETLINVVLAIQQGVQAAQPAAPGLSAADIRAALLAQRPVMLQNYGLLFMASFALTYRDVPTEELSPYVAFLKSDAGRHFNEVSLASLQAALTDASGVFGRSLPTTKDGANS